MSELIQRDSMSDAWIETLRIVNRQQDGKMVHVLTAVSQPELPEDVEIRAALDRILTPSRRRPKLQSVATIANTIFPYSLYPDPGMCWSPEPGADNTAVNEAAERLYRNYATIFPNLGRVHRENRKGTYFSRMMSWPGKDMGGLNQLEKRIEHLRSMKRAGKTAFNASDLAMGDPAADDGADLGLSIYASGDNRTRSFPCLVHVDIGVYQNKLNLLGVYRHQYLIQKGYGNMLGLHRLQKFLAQQSGYDVGELAVQATFATAEHDVFGKQSVDRLALVKLQEELVF